MQFEDILKKPSYSLHKDEKEKLLTERIVELTEHHKECCLEYKKILESVSYKKERISSLEQIPFLPVRIFKQRELKSVSQEAVVKMMTSSGTTGQSVSKIYLDRQTAANQQKALVKIVSDFTGASRMPMIILDCPSVIKNRSMFSARGAGILGFSIFGSKKIYALNDDMQLDVEGVQKFLEEYKNQRILLFGFTFMVWQHFYKELVRLRNQGVNIELSNGILIHGGGWKKLSSEAVSPEEFHESLNRVCGLNNIFDYYGMVEQTGCIYMQCECGYLHASNFSDIIVRNPRDFSACAIGERGIIQVLSTIPESYPGHSLLTEDEGIILGEDDCPCGRKGKYFKVIGRLKNAEIRGCSDTYAIDHDIKNFSEEECIGSEEQVLQKITYLVGNGDRLNHIRTVPVRTAFDKYVVEFLSGISKELLTNTQARAFADIVSLGFWLRKASVLNMKKKFAHDDENVCLGRGVAFHIAPSNVPVNYAYSLFTGLLCGNANVVRVPTKDFPQIAIINNAICKTLETYPKMKDYICLVRYERSSEINDFLSSICDVRIVWGGDMTISEIRRSQLPARATEITFADRYSLALIDSDIYMELQSKDRVAQDFYNDTYLWDQNACTSPCVVVWIGSRKEEAKEVFWRTLQALVDEKYNYQPIMGADKLMQEFLAATDEKLGAIKLLKYQDNSLFRIKVGKLCPALMEYRGTGGYFYEYDCENALQLRDFCNDTHCQTVGIIGDKSIVKPLVYSGIKGVDRVVEVGHTMDFDLNWDGYNLVDQLTRTVVI